MVLRPHDPHNSLSGCDAGVPGILINNDFSSRFHRKVARGVGGHDGSDLDEIRVSGLLSKAL
jgi:hypothetical protein